MQPIVWTIAGSDPSGGAGLQADIKTLNSFGVYACAIPTAITVQSTLGVQRVVALDPQLVEQQIAALAEDLPPKVIKLGMLATESIVSVLVDWLPRLDCIVVCDPVLCSTSGAPLLVPEAVELLRSKLLPMVNLLTPNIPEAELLCGARAEPGFLIDQLLALGPAGILLKGGHADSDVCRDVYSNGEESFSLESPRVDTRATHGTGCTLSSAIAAGLALNHPIADTLKAAKAYINQGLRLAEPQGGGKSSLFHGAPSHHAVDQPTLTALP